MLMDEPFSAVDPVVREQLQNEFLRLQSELGKTIVFVTHDIDEAIKLGDQVAVLRVGGKLAQLATPADLLSNPVDDFVAGFVGRDRGYRALGFEPVSGLQLDPETTVRLGSDVSAAAAVARDGWVLVVDEHESAAGLARGRRRRDPRVAADHPAVAAPRRHRRRSERHVPCSARRGVVVTDRPRGHRRRGGSVRRHDHGRERGPAPRTSPADRRWGAAMTVIDAPPTVPTLPGVPSTSGVASSSPWHFWAYFNAHLHQDLTLAVGSRVAVRTARRDRPRHRVATRLACEPLRWIYPPMLSISGLLYTIPSIALFVLIPPLLGLKALNPIQVPIALTIYSVALLVRVVADGLGSVPEDVLQAATAMGFGPIQRLFKVELPIAVPVIAAGLRVATVSNVSIVAVAGTIGLANLGQLFTTGFQLSSPTAYYPPIVLGIVLVRRACADLRSRHRAREPAPHTLATGGAGQMIGNVFELADRPRALAR